MSMDAMRKLREMLCREVDDIAQKGTLSSGDLEAAQKLTDTIKNIDKIYYLEDEGSYSERGGSYDGGMGGGSGSYRYGSYPMSYARQHRMANGRFGGSYRGERGYSRDEGKEAILYQLGEMMDKATTSEQREVIRKALEELREA